MTPELRIELRIELLKLTKPNFDSPDMKSWIERAKELEDYVNTDRPDTMPGDLVRPKARAPKI